MRNDQLRLTPTKLEKTSKKVAALHWASFAQIAHNLIRRMAILDNPDRPSFAKKIRDDFLFIPGKLVSGSRQIVLRVNKSVHC
jgi:hypothetical protein